jgi:hypothetical protein
MWSDISVNDQRSIGSNDMDRNPFRRLIRLRLLLLVSASCHLFSAGNAIAQSRTNSGSAKETASQRYLPLPQLDSANPRQQLEWLKQLKGVLSANPEASDLSALKGLSSDDLKVLQEAIKQGGAEAALRSVEKSGSLPGGGLTPEQVSKAIADPAMREKLKRALEQFANDAKLPGTSTSNGPNGVPFPKNQPSPNRADVAALQTQPGSDSTTNEASAPNQRTNQSHLEVLAKPSKRESNGADGKKSVEDFEPLPNEPSLQQQTLPQRETDAASNPRNPRKSTAKGINSGTRNLIPSENALHPSSSNLVPNETAVPSISNSQRPTDPKEKLSGTPGADSGSSTSGIARRTTPVILPKRDGRTDANRTPGSTKANSPTARGNTFTDARREDSKDSRKATDVEDFIRHQQSSSPSSANAAGSTSASSVIPSNSPSDQKPSSVDVRTDLEQRGFAATLRQLVAEARRSAENEIAAQRQSGAAKDGQSSLDATLDGLYEAVKRLPKDAANDTSVAAPRPDSNQPQMTPIAGTPAAPSPGPSSSSEPTSPISSVVSRVSEAADKALSGITRPEPTPMIPRAVNGTMSTTPDRAKVRSSEGASVLWLGMLLALLSIGWYAATRLANSMFVSSQAEMLAAAPIHPAEISTRRDIVRAFHQFALRPMMPVADWWTHQQVAQEVATSTPSLEPAIQQLAEIYEQARYLPEETEFTADQIGTARRALEQCQTSSAIGS